MPLATRFQAFTPEHDALIGLCLLGCLGFALLGRRGDDVALRRALGVAIPLFTVPMQVLQLLPDDFGLGTSLPLQVCDLAWIVATYALWTRSRWACAVTYFWGLTLVPQAILTPSLDQAFPDPRFFMFWGMHLVVVWAAVYLVAAGNRPDWRGYRVAVLLTAGWAVGVMVLNALIGTNYGYLNRKPSVATALDLLGPWPWYVVAEVAIVAGVWAVMTWPWVRRDPAARDPGARGPGAPASSQPPATAPTRRANRPLSSRRDGAHGVSNERAPREAPIRGVRRLGSYLFARRGSLRD